MTGDATDKALSEAGLPPLNDGEFTVPPWATKVIDELADASREPTLGHKIMRIARLVAVLFAFLGLTFFVVLVLYWFGQPYGKPVVEFTDGIHVLAIGDDKDSDGAANGTTTVAAGDDILIQSSYCKHHNTLSTTVRREFHDDLVFQLPDYTTNVPKGCGVRFSTVLKIPENLPPDTYTLSFTFVYQINPLRSVSYEFETNEFTVTDPVSTP